MEKAIDELESIEKIKLTGHSELLEERYLGMNKNQRHACVWGLKKTGWIVVLFTGIGNMEEEAAWDQKN